MKIIDFKHKHIEQATALAKANYEEERLFVTVLPMIDILPELTTFANNDLGVCIIENGKMLGFLCAYSPWDNIFTTNAKGTFSPIHAHGAVKENREMIYKRLYQGAAEKWVKAKIACHCIGLYAHDIQAINSFFVNGFGLRTIDAIKPMEEIECLPSEGYKFCEVDLRRNADILQLKNLVITHFCKSPIFMQSPQMSEQDLRHQSTRRKSRYFCAYYNNKIIAFFEIINSGENFICDEEKMMNICGAFCLLEHRGKGVIQNLLNFMIVTLKNENYTKLGVDFESFNPTAYNFWLKYFIAYTNTVVRRIDEEIFRNSFE